MTTPIFFMPCSESISWFHIAIFTLLLGIVLIVIGLIRDAFLDRYLGSSLFHIIGTASCLFSTFLFWQ